MIEATKARLNDTVATTAATLARWRDDARGVVSIEVAFVLPLMLTMYFGLVDITNMLSANRKVTLTASTLADLTTQASGNITTSDITTFFAAAKPIMYPFNSTGMGLELYGYRRDGNNVVLTWQRKEGSSCGGVPAANTTEMKNLTSEGNDVVVARACFNWHAILGKVVSAGPLKLTEQLVLRPRQTATLRCTNC